MGTSLLVISAFALFAIGLHLWSLVGQARSKVVDRGSRGSLPRALVDVVVARIDDGLLDVADSGGLGTLKVVHREAHDSVRTVDDLLERIDRECAKVRPAEAQELAKHIYQLQQTLGVPDEEIEAVVQGLLATIAGALFLGRPIARVETISAGTLVDRTRMWPLNGGSRVAQPLGVVLLDAEGLVISKAKVLCC